MLHSLASVEQDKDQKPLIQESTVFVRLDDCMQCYVQLQRCLVPPKEEEEEDDDNVQSPTLAAAQIQERREELNQTPPSSIRLSEHLAYLYDTPAKVEGELGDFAHLHTYDPLYDISPLRAIRFSPGKPSPVRSVMKEEEEEKEQHTDV